MGPIVEWPAASRPATNGKPPLTSIRTSWKVGVMPKNQPFGKAPAFKVTQRKYVPSGGPASMSTRIEPGPKGELKPSSIGGKMLSTRPLGTEPAVSKLHVALRPQALAVVPQPTVP